MPISMIIWFLLGFTAWIALAVYFGEVRIADLFIACFCSVAGPLIPLIMGASYAGMRLEGIARKVIWRRKRKPKPLVTQA